MHHTRTPCFAASTGLVDAGSDRPDMLFSIVLFSRKKHIWQKSTIGINGICAAMQLLSTQKKHCVLRRYNIVKRSVLAKPYMYWKRKGAKRPV